ncbi:recombinase family protein [Mycolicibacterium baixiangningiae]|uniref:recombinase family protein n=1 Tax=Mycolicibacterium baixiangningiae TaxID=2761578 RepID=UPI001867B130|nr:recombinase family protein [Mycolicibacterium baixiangningiae]
MRVALYLRQSQDRSGEQLGIDRQREDCLRLIAARGWTIAAEFVDNDVSALSRKPRPQFIAMMARVDAGEFDVIVARHMDRLLRRLAELESVLERCQSTSTTIVTAADGIDTGTDGGRTVARIMASIAQGEVERKAARHRSASVQAAQQGRWVGGGRPFGYDADGMTIRPNEAALIRQGFADFLAGESFGEIARRWVAAGYRTPQGNEWSRYAVRDVLTNPRYCGLRRHVPNDQLGAMRKNPELGIVGPAQWAAIVDEPTWRAVARTMASDDRRRAPVAAKGLLTGVGLCGVCGQTVQRSGASVAAPQYRCRSRQHVTRRAEPVDQYVSAVAVARLAAPDAGSLWTTDTPDAAELMAEADALRRRRDDLAELVADGAMTPAQFRSANERVLTKLGDVETRIAAFGRSSPLAIVAETDVEAAWAGLSVAQRRSVIDALMVPVLHLPGRGTRTFNPETVEIRWKG